MFVSEPVFVCWETRIVFLSLLHDTRLLNNQEQEEWTIFRGPTVGSEYRTCSLFQRCPLCWYRANKHSISVLQWYLNNKHLKIIIKVWYSDHLYSDAQFLLLTWRLQKYIFYLKAQEKTFIPGKCIVSKESAIQVLIPIKVK